MPTKTTILFKDTSAAFLIYCLRRNLETISKKVCFTSPLKQRLLNRVFRKRARSWKQGCCWEQFYYLWKPSLKTSQQEWYLLAFNVHQSLHVLNILTVCHSLQMNSVIIRFEQDKPMLCYSWKFCNNRVFRKHKKKKKKKGSRISPNWLSSSLSSKNPFKLLAIISIPLTTTYTEKNCFCFCNWNPAQLEPFHYLCISLRKVLKAECTTRIKWWMCFTLMVC